jgi:hypothetical protein
MNRAIPLVVLAAGITASSASAAVLNGTFGFAPLGTPATVVTARNLSQATSFKFGATNFVNNAGLPSYNGVANIFHYTPPPIRFVTATTSSIILPGGSFGSPLNNSYPALFTLAFGGANIVFSSTSQTFSSSGPNSLNITFLGTAVDTNGVYTGVANAAMTMNFTLLSGNQYNYSTSFAAAIPAPGAAALLGVGGLVATRRRR